MPLIPLPACPTAFGAYAPCFESTGVLMITGFFNDHSHCEIKLFSSKKQPTLVQPAEVKYAFDSRAYD
jgi:hypothetical protein